MSQSSPTETAHEAHESMDSPPPKRYKLRWLGAIVLVGWALIFFPLLFNGDGHRELMENPVPEAPSIESKPQDLSDARDKVKALEAAVEKKMQQAQLPDETLLASLEPQENQEAQKQVSGSRQAPNTDQTVSQATSTTAPAAAQSSESKLSKIEPSPNQTDAQPEIAVVNTTATSQPQLAPEAALQIVKTSQEAWSLQVGSFSRQANAIEMRDRLLKQQWQAYIKRSGTYHRVYIGPVLSKAELSKLRASLKAKGIDSFPVKFQP